VGPAVVFRYLQPHKLGDGKEKEDVDSWSQRLDNVEDKHRRRKR
jgi:hypothetical protein